MKGGSGNILLLLHNLLLHTYCITIPTSIIEGRNEMDDKMDDKRQMWELVNSSIESMKLIIDGEEKIDKGYKILCQMTLERLLMVQILQERN